MKLFCIGLFAAIFNFQVGFAAEHSYQVKDRKADILFVIDNSGSMTGNQIAMLNIVEKFSNQLQKLEIDFHIGVTTTDAWLAQYNGKDSFRKLRDGSGSQASGIFVVKSSTPNISEILRINLNQGIAGSGDERAFSSFQEVLSFSGNSDFRRADAFLSIIVLSDEDDFSSNTLTYVPGQFPPEAVNDPLELDSSHPLLRLYNHPGLITPAKFSQYLEELVGSKNYSFSSIVIKDLACKTQQSENMPGLRLGRRYLELSSLTNGFVGSICELESAISDYANYLSLVTTVPTEFYEIKLDRKPIIETIVVKINGRLIKPDSENGWTFDSQTLSLKIWGDAIPKKGDIVSVTYDFDVKKILKIRTQVFGGKVDLVPVLSP